MRELFPKCGVFCRLSLGELPRVPDRSTGGTGGARCTTVRASGPYLRYGYRRFAPYHVLVHSAHPYRVGPGFGAASEDVQVTLKLLRQKSDHLRLTKPRA